MRILQKKPNMAIRERIQKTGIPQYEIARRCGVNEGSFCRWLRYELPDTDERLQLILSVLDDIEHAQESATI